MLVTIVFPNLNEEATIGKCVNQAKLACEELEIDFEIIVADNGSSDQSVEKAILAGAKVVHVAERGYGAAILGGIEAAQGTYIIQLDADNTYRLDELQEILAKLNSGADLVIGNRFGNKKIDKGAMPFLHKFVGNPVLSFLGRVLYDSGIKDFHCGLRAYRKDIIRSSGVFLSGMEFASELILKVSLLNYKVEQFSTKLYVDERSGKSHLNTFRDGYRHLRFLLLFSRKRYTSYVGFLFYCISWTTLTSLSFGLTRLSGVQFGPQTYLFCVGIGIFTLQIVLIDTFRRNLIKEYLNPKFGKFKDSFQYEKIAIAALFGFLVGILGIFKTMNDWIAAGFGPLESQLTLRLSAPSILLIINSLQVFSFAITIFITEYNFESLRRRGKYLEDQRDKN